MKTWKRSGLAAPVLVALLAAGLAATAALAGTGRPAGMSPQAYDALMSRSRALNALYAGAQRVEPAWERALRLRGEALNRRYGAGQQAVRVGPPAEPAWSRALRLRGEELNRRYVGTPATTASGTFDWRDAGIGAGAALGLVLLAAALRPLVHMPGRPAHLH